MKWTSVFRTASYVWRRNTFAKLLLSFIILNVLNLIIVFGLFYYKSNQIMKDEIDQLSHKLLAQTQNVSNYLYTSTVKGGYDLYYDESVYSAMFSGDEVDVYDQHNLVTRLNRFLQSNPIVQSIYLYNFELDTVISTAYPNMSTNLFPDQEMTSFMRKFHYDSPRIPYLLRHGMPGKPKDSPTLSMIVTEPSSDSELVRGAMIINIDDVQLKNLLTEMSSDPVNQLFILQSDGEFVTDSSSSLFAGEHSTFRYNSVIQRAHDASGTFIRTIDGHKYVIAYQKTNLSSTGFVYVSVYPYSILFKSLIRIRDITLLSSALLLIVSVLISVLLSRNIYDPIRSLTQYAKKQTKNGADFAEAGDIETISRVLTAVIKKNETLEHGSSLTSKLLREQFLRNILLGYEDSRSSFQRLVQEHGIELGAAERIRIIVIRIDHYRQVEVSYESESRYLLRYSVCNIAEESLAGAFRTLSVDIGTDHIAVVLDQTMQGEETLLAGLEKVRDNISKYLKLSVTIGIGDAVETLTEASYSYEGALTASQYRMFYGRGTILFRERMFVHSTSDYPYDKEKMIAAELKLGRPQKVKEAIDSLLGGLEKYPHRDLYAVLAQMIMNVMKTVQLTQARPNHLPALSYDGVYAQLSKLETREEVRESLTELFIGATEEKTESKSAKSQAAIEKGIQYIEENYQQVEFSVTNVAEYLRYSVSYLNKLFNEHTAFSVHEYINRKRLLKAKELIEQTDILINDIAGMVGFSSSNYFYFVFKKEFGQTPNACRRMHHAESG
ncbi:helix-turn-helix domain-containing protein [Paenibacillus sp. ATY16]|uniref:helix-turn-helix domain-containing protein n=1 Tax=Paenibacillus sp. ATY16 TaxID=1759312 RepID=UPI00200C8DEF|nr:helix-turn-helix domain-containing protein [Paenibacillus sp. ATY16]MCK9858656.1 helix-turn-helix domain-containing protein [Paenibacillus sp. ATY16]